MGRRYNLAHFLLVSVVVLCLTPLMVCVDVQAQIAFMSDRDRDFDIYVMDTDGRNQRRLTNNHHADWHPSWSPGGTRIVFSSRQVLPARNQPEREFLLGKDHGVAPHDIYVMDTDGGNRKRLTEHLRYDISPSWSPDGQRIAFASDRTGPWEIFVMDADGGNPQNLTNNPFEDREPSWSPDGTRIVFRSGRDRQVANGFPAFEIYVMDADGKNQQRLTENQFQDANPSWSPDSERIVFCNNTDGHYEIYVMDAKGDNKQRLTENQFHDTDPSWSPDGQQIAFVSYRIRLFQSDIYVMDADGGNERNLTQDNSWNTSPAWYTPAFSVAPVGKTLTMWGRLKQVDR